ncbi:unnamed protein product [Paramecium sonneborni]|uniref:Uncharacterized protein n=1 Tax=Paramecium sonneborni TaxID=65129 RepID=A0A8S1QJ24_9CILI|nr:unnamed protein product [Paramecium sonneborni]CAD8115346.1 unnamed protein product [Paramecium sonneborni]
MNSKTPFDEQSPQIFISEWDDLETDLTNYPSSPQVDGFIKQIQNHKFVIGISKPEETRIGLSSIKKSKITIKGILGISNLQI